MHVLLKATDTYKGVIIITHAEVSKFKSLQDKMGIKLEDKYHIYGHWTRDNLPQAPLAMRFVEDFFYQPHVDSREYDFVNAGRCIQRKGVDQILTTMINAATNYNSKSCLVLIKDSYSNAKPINNDPHGVYYKSILNRYNTLKDDIKKRIDIVTPDKNNNKIFCHENSLPLEELAKLFNNSKIYIHNVREFDESRVISSALVSGCIVHCNSSLDGHYKIRKETNSFAEYNDISALSAINRTLNLQKNYRPSKAILNYYLGNNTISNFLKQIYNKHNYIEKIQYDMFVDCCNVSELSLRIAGHHNDVPWSINRGELPTHHITTYEQFKTFVNHLP